MQTMEIEMMTKPLHQEEPQERQPEQPPEGAEEEEQKDDAEYSTVNLDEKKSWTEAVSLAMTVCGDVVFNCSYASSQARDEVEKLRSETIASTSDVLLWNHESRALEIEFYRKFLFDEATTMLRCGE